ncbi:tripartite tricarboxylate transporter TctB family protein [Pollutimonas sp. M17]|uniref:tripartite tricarboxylate transporter TctB family protein n=1 Tax=Pollutimonas sp. M17 TaxID=2962065 RepID=UPI0021F3D347|nr:tripartite tricarboxylate transporter TctB family protein [Pollutimonas sp. M17]UYO93267.1 tripartite tricarboxylate transporter TctB family protein [Pollutimonas sp. M17]HWK72308.1 tripartite tricarboxylate transporter TctB family protein [Burkholderiaceae bacterium]
MNDRILGIAALVFAALMAWFGWGIQAPFSYEPVGPRAFPMLLAGIIALCGAWLAFRGRGRAEPNPPGANGRIALMVVYCFLYAFFFEPLGFIIATTAMTILVGRLFGGAWTKVALGGAVMSVLFFLLFDRALDVVLPLGILENFL